MIKHLIWPYYGTGLKVEAANNKGFVCYNYLNKAGLNKNFSSRIFISKVFIKKKLVIWLSMRIYIKNNKIILINNFLKLYYEKNKIKLLNKKIKYFNI